MSKGGYISLHHAAKDLSGERFGKFDSNFKQSLSNRHVIWLHAVSVGEVNICTHLIAALEPRIPNIKIVVSTGRKKPIGGKREELTLNLPKDPVRGKAR